MANDLNPLENEYTNRRDEVLSYNISLIKGKVSVQRFLDKLCNWVEFLEKKQTYKKKIRSLYYNKSLLLSQNTVEEKGELLLSLLRYRYEKIKKFFKTNNHITLPTEDEVLKNHRKQSVFTTSLDEDLGITLERLSKKLSLERTLAVEEIEQMLYDLNHIRLDFQGLNLVFPINTYELEELEEHLQELKKAKDTYHRLSNYFSTSDYELLKGVWEWKNEKPSNINQIRFLLSSVGLLISGNSKKIPYEELQDSLLRLQDAVSTVDKRLQENNVRNKYAWYNRIIKAITALLPRFIDILSPKH